MHVAPWHSSVLNTPSSQQQCAEYTLVPNRQLPKFKEDLFMTRHQDRDFYLVPTAEVGTLNWCLAFGALPTAEVRTLNWCLAFGALPTAEA